MSEHAHLIQVTTFHPAQGQREAVLSVCREAEDRFRDTEGCFGAQVCSVSEEPEWVAIVSRWDDPRALEKTDAIIAQHRDRMRDLIREQPRGYHMTPI